MLRVDAPSFDEPSEDFSKLNLGSGAPWNHRLSATTPGGQQSKRGSLQLSTYSDESRPQSSMQEEEEMQLIVLKHPVEVETEEEEEKTRWEKPKRVMEEVYTDKDRAAMVVIGTKDIKVALETQKEAMEFKKTPEGRNTAVLFQQARFLMQQTRYAAALSFIDRALQIEPLQSLWHVEKARCYFCLLKPKTALSQVNYVLEKDPRNFQALCLKGDILYSIWDLESSMLCFVEGLRLRPDNPECLRGVHKVKMALEEIPTNKIKKRTRKSKRKTKNVEITEEKVCFNEGSKASDKQYLPRFSPTLTSQIQVSSSAASNTDETDSLSFEDNVQNVQISKRPATAKPRRGRRFGSVGSDSNASDVSIPTPSRKHRLDLDKASTGSRRSSCRSHPSKTSLDVTDVTRRNSALKSLEDLLRDLREDDKESSKAPSTTKETKRTIPVRPRRPSSCIAPKISRGLLPDKMFLESILRDKGLKTVQTPHSMQALQLAKEAYKFVTDRRRFWTYREKRISSAPPLKRKVVPEEDPQLSDSQKEIQVADIIPASKIPF